LNRQEFQADVRYC